MGAKHRMSYLGLIAALSLFVVTYTVDAFADTDKLKDPLATVKRSAPENPSAASIKDDEILTRYELSSFLIDYFGMSRTPYNQFSVFRDVSVNDPIYPTVDTIRRFHIVFPDEQGFFHPDDPATQLDAWLAIGKLVFPKDTLTPRETRRILEPLAGHRQVPRYAQKRVARLFTARILDPQHDVPLQPKEPMTRQALNRLFESLRQNQGLVVKQEKEAELRSLNDVATLPAGITFQVTPSQALNLRTIEVGADYYFQTRQALTLPNGVVIPTGSSTRASLIEKTEKVLHLQFTWLRSSREDRIYELLADVELPVPKRRYDPLHLYEAQAYLVTGDTVQVTTQPVPQKISTDEEH